MAYPERFTLELTDAVRRGLGGRALRAQLSPALDALLADPRVERADRLVLTGSGDSLFAATATRPALRRWVGRSVDVLTALELSRYEAPLLGPADAVLGISNSGSSTRTRESLLLARERGALTVAVLGSRSGPLADVAELVLHRPVEAPAGVDASRARVYLNLIEYVATLITLYGLGLELGVRVGRLAHADAVALGDRLDAAVDAIGEVARRVEPSVAALAAELAGADTIWIIGGGPNRGTADYLAAKFHEQLPWNGISQDLEEWAHLQYFLTLAWKARSAVLVLAPPGNALDRAEELVAGIAGAGGRAIVVGHPAHGRFPGAHTRLDVDLDAHELLTPVIYHVPVQLLVLHLARLGGVPLIPLRRQDDYWLIRGGGVRTTTVDLS
ncbi:MAG TPA: SIS domain-containing protein [Methylomirabilota bacterium]|nr:SIS domain-containing protein [Methylomirabilota bacterium]